MAPRRITTKAPGPRYAVTVVWPAWPQGKRGEEGARLAITVVVEFVDGDFEPVRVILDTPPAQPTASWDVAPTTLDGEPITATVLREIPLGSVIKLARDRAWLSHAGSHVEPGERLRDALQRTEAQEIKTIEEWRTLLERAQRLSGAAGGLEDLVRPGRPKRGRRYPPDHWRGVAAVYAAAYREGDNPTSAVKNHYSISQSTAAKWVARARTEGYLGPTVKGRPGGLIHPEGEER